MVHNHFIPIAHDSIIYKRDRSLIKPNSTKEIVPLWTFSLYKGKLGSDTKNTAYKEHFLHEIANKLTALWSLFLESLL